MSVNSIPSVRSEAEELRTVNSVLLETFSQCHELKSDLLQYSTNPRKDLQDFKEKLVDLAEIQKDVSAIIRTMETIESEIQDKEEGGKLNFETISDFFTETHLSALEEKYTNEEAEKIISAVDAYISDQNSGVNMGNEELLVTATKESYLDPLTKLPIQDPVKSKTCHHSFERNSIWKHLQKYKRCPYSGCVKNLSREDLVEDLALKRELLKMRRNQNK
ncbi:hypothetical protein AVEN_174699-1 [Araneus ventricosus]|uniref:E3 SUMO-protein ligase NSE2 n=1 Tax=Araneus ventricosus TaxID=182803 RepID=A0A4Y2BMC6_ARAVE|nr:hypothetical protein AVEN_174699-1 [Araneus ventricosus]